MYKIEIWRHHSIRATVTSDSLEDIKEWYIVNWKDCYDHGGCTFYVHYKEEENGALRELFW